MLLPSFLGLFFSSQIFPQLQDWHFITWLPKSEIAGITRKDFAWKGEERKLFMITFLLLKQRQNRKNSPKENTFSLSGYKKIQYGYYIKMNQQKKSDRKTAT